MTQLTRTQSNVVAIGEQYGFDQDKVSLIKSQIAQGASDNELALFLYTAQRVGLDPLAKQIYCIMRKDRGSAKMTIQTGIDGYRLIADRTGNYAPGRANTFEYGDNGKITSATAYVMKYARGAWLEVSATAYWDEYVAMYEGKPQNLWNTKPRVMLGKCAEALALRRAFPAELSGIYTSEEMSNAEGEVIPTPQPRQIAAVPAQDEQKRQEAMQHIAVKIGELQALVTSYVPEDFGGYSLDDLRAYFQDLKQLIVEASTPPIDTEPITPPEPSPELDAFINRFGMVLSTPDWNGVVAELGLVAAPNTPEEWAVLAGRMDEHLRVTVQ